MFDHNRLLFFVACFCSGQLATQYEVHFIIIGVYAGVHACVHLLSMPENPILSIGILKSLMFIAEKAATMSLFFMSRDYIISVKYGIPLCNGEVLPSHCICVHHLTHKPT